MPISNEMLKTMIEGLQTRLGTMESRMNAYEQDMKANKIILERIEGYSKLIITFLKWCAGILASTIVGLIILYLSHVIGH